MSYQYIIAAYAIFFLINFFLFGLQRTALLIDREFEPSYVRAILPQWIVFAKLFFLCKIIALGFIFYQSLWQIAISLVICDFILGVTLPIPYKIYKKPLNKRAEILLKSKNLGQPLHAINNSKYFK